jgi:hypothetical protein
VGNYLQLTGDGADYLRSPLNSAWKSRLQVLDGLLGRIEALVGPAKIPLVLVFVPLRPLAALSMPEFARRGIDPYQLGHALGDIARHHDMLYIDETKSFAAAPDVDSVFYRVDGHPAAAGHAIIAASVVATLLHDPAFSACGNTVPLTVNEVNR